MSRWARASFSFAIMLVSLSTLVYGCTSEQPGPSVQRAATAVPSPSPRIEPKLPSPTATQTYAPFTPTVTPTPVPATATPLPTSTPEPTVPAPDERPELFRGDATLPLVSLTFDIGWSDDHVDEVLGILRAKQVRATFFPTGQWAEDYPDHILRIVADGHEIGNHSFAHPDYRHIADEEIVADLARADETLLAITGRSTRPLFRFPSGARDERSTRVVNGEGYRSIYWTVESGDWRPELSGTDVYRRVMGAVGNGSIIVMHADSASAAQSLDAIIDSLHARGLGILQLSSLPE